MALKQVACDTVRSSVNWSTSFFRFLKFSDPFPGSLTAVSTPSFAFKVQRSEKSEKSGVVQRKKGRARKTLKNDALDAKIGVDTAVNEPGKGSENLSSENEKKDK